MARLTDLPHIYTVDRDTLGMAGAPEIHHAIFGKFDAAAAFVADATYVSTAQDKLLPNPNVLVELGYALKSLGPSRVVQVFNTAYGPVESLPFDLKMRRTLTYKLDETATTEERQAERAELAKRLENALRPILQEDVAPRPANAKKAELRIIGDLRVGVDSSTGSASLRVTGRASGQGGLDGCSRLGKGAATTSRRVRRSVR